MVGSDRPDPEGAAMDEDILSQGDDREPRPWPRRLGVIAAVVAVAVGASCTSPSPATAGRPPRPLTRRPRPRIPAPAPPLIESVPVGPNGIIGQTLPWEDSLRLPVTGRQPAWNSPGRCRPTPPPRPPAATAPARRGRSGFSPTARSRRPGRHRRSGRARRRRPGPVAHQLPVGRRPRHLGRGRAGSQRHRRPAGAAGGAAARIDQATDRGLLLTSANEQAGAVVYTLPADRDRAARAEHRRQRRVQAPAGLSSPSS